MGDRGNIALLDDDGNALNIYLHWHGSERARLVAEALNTVSARRRWSDPDYLRRILCDQIMRLTGTRDMELGMGLSVNHPVDDEYGDLLVVDPNTQTVGFAPLSYPVSNVVQLHSFDEWIETHLGET